VSRKIVESLIAGKGVNEISRGLKVGKAKIRKVRILAEKNGYLDGSVPLPPFPQLLFPEDRCRKFSASEVDFLLSEHEDWIKDRIAADWHAITIFEQLPIKVSRSSFYRFLDRHKLNPSNQRPTRVVPEIIHKPGEALQVDWGKVGTVACPLTGKKLTVWAFVGVLGYSRYRMVRLTIALDLDTTLSLLESMLQEIGGVPVKLTSDNPKVFALKACKYDPLIHPVYERFAGYYDTAVECLAPADPKKKGKVERPMPFIRRLLEPLNGDFRDLLHAQKFIDQQLTLANDRRHGTTGERPIERLLNQEISALKPLPKLFWEREEYHEGSVRSDGHIRFRGKYYSVAEHLIGEDLVVIGNQTFVWLYHNGQLVETHRRCTDPMKSKETKPEHLKPWERAMTDTSVYRDRARSIGPHVDELIVKIIGNGLGVIDFRQVWGILSLDKSFDYKRIDDACRHALEMGSRRLRTVRNYLETSPKPRSSSPADSEIPFVTEDGGEKDRVNRFVRSIKEYGAIVAQSTKH